MKAHASPTSLPLWLVQAARPANRGVCDLRLGSLVKVEVPGCLRNHIGLDAFFVGHYSAVVPGLYAFSFEAARGVPEEPVFPKRKQAVERRTKRDLVFVWALQGGRVAQQGWAQ